MAVDTPMAPGELTPVLPLQVPVSTSRPPSLPPTVPTSGTNEFWTVTRHVFAAAYPRSRVGSFATGKANSGDAAGVRLSSAEVQSRVASMQEEQYTAPLQGSKDEGHLWLAVNCYRSKTPRTAHSGRAATTMILAHATGLHKEVGACTSSTRTLRFIRSLMIMLCF